jgi:plastocyanin
MLAVLLAGVLGLATVSAHAETVEVTITNLVFSPTELNLQVGDTIEWINKDVIAHTATARNGAWDVMIPAKKTTSQVLTKAGIFDFYCRFHPNMKGKMTVR